MAVPFRNTDAKELLLIIFWEYSLIINKHNQKLINMFKTQMLKFI